MAFCCRQHYISQLLHFRAPGNVLITERQVLLILRGCWEISKWNILKASSFIRQHLSFVRPFVRWAVFEWAPRAAATHNERVAKWGSRVARSWAWYAAPRMRAQSDAFFLWVAVVVAAVTNLADLSDSPMSTRLSWLRYDATTATTTAHMDTPSFAHKFGHNAL